MSKTRFPPFLIHELVAQQAALRPHHLAIVCNDQQLTYGELDARANQLAQHLRARGVGPETLIPICVTRSVEMAIGTLGILKAGAAYVPIDPSYPAERIAFMLADSAAPVLLTQSHLKDHLTQHISLATDHQSPTAVFLDTDNFACESREAPAVTVTPDNLAYVIYTSGSTGKPKGTMLTHANLRHYVQALQREFQLTPDDRYLHLASIAFSSARRHLLLPLAHGATVILADEDQRLDPLPLFQLIKTRGVTVFDAVPSFQRHCTNALLELEDASRTALLDNQLRLIVSASEPLLSDVPRTWMHEFQHPAQHVHMIGQTETSGIIALHRITAEDVRGPIHPVPVGRPIANTEIYLLNEQRQPVAVGEVGEIYVRSAGVGRGYLHQPELTAERFLPSAEVSFLPTSDLPIAHVVKTGDFARLRPDGILECVGRQDAQVKIRGFRVELSEIEAVVMAHPNVSECAVVVREEEPNRKQLVAYVVYRAAQDTTRNELRALAQQRLPDYMQPAAFVSLVTLPRTPNGKVDRRALPMPDDAFLDTEYIAPRTPIEERLAQIWGAVMQVERVGRHDDFFALGGNSLLASQVVARVRAAFQIDLPLRAIFTAPTVAGLAEITEPYLQQVNNSAPLTRLARTEAPLSFAQQRLWFLDQFEPGTATYNLSNVFRWCGPLQVAALHKALQIVVARHESLRTRFVAAGDKAVQLIAESVPVEIPVLDVAANDALSTALTLADEPFDLAQTPLWRVRLMRLQPDEHWLVLMFHHIISDGWSVGIFLSELRAAYQAVIEAREVALPALPIQYADYAEWQREQLTGTVLEEALRHWKQHLADAPALLEMPTDKPRPAVQRYRGAQVALQLPAALTAQVKAFSQQHGATLFMTLLAVWQTLLARYSGQDQIVVGTPVAGRPRVETESLIGFFVNTLALRGDLAGDPTFLDLLHRTREASLQAFTYQSLPFEKLVEELHPQRSLSYSPIFQVMFALQNAPMAVEQAAPLPLTPVPLPSTSAKFDLSLDVYETAGGLDTRLEYDTDLFEAATAERLLQHFQTLLAAAVAQPSQRLSALPLLTTAEQRQMLVEWNQRYVPIPPVCLHQLFEAHAQQQPDAIAVVWQEQRLSYGELNARANQLAHYLQRVGIGPEVIVGICVERSLDMIVALLGVLKAGGAYLPLDPNYPAERLQHMLHTANVSVLLTQARLQSPTTNHQLPTTIYLDTDWPRIAQESRETPASAATPDNLAYVIFTSGSTGQSKGVSVTHRNVVNAFAAWQEAYQLSALRSHLQMASFSFDVCVGDVARALGSGATLVLCPTETLLEPAALFDLLRREAIEAAEFVPVVVRPLLDWLEQTGQRLDFMNLVVVGSDVWQMDEYRRLRQVCAPSTRIISSYGVTEATIDSTYFEVTSEAASDGIVPIGRPFANTQIYLLDAHLHPVPIGGPGELYIGGDGVTRGYLGRAELTAEKFATMERKREGERERRSDGEKAGEAVRERAAGSESIPLPLFPSLSLSLPPSFAASRLYRTGDRARYRADGTIELLGRADNQVKLRGYRIELGEIEAALLQHPQVSECVVLVREDAPGDHRLVAYVNSVGPDLASATLREHLKAQLPEYMLPSAFVAVTSWPLTPNGKIDRKALPAPVGTTLSSAPDFVAPRTSSEQTIAEIWADLLHASPISIHDNFFVLGGHSLLATKVVARLRDAFAVSLPLRLLFEAATLAELATAIDAAINERLPETISESDLEALLTELESLSDEEAEALMEQMS